MTLSPSNWHKVIQTGLPFDWWLCKIHFERFQSLKTYNRTKEKAGMEPFPLSKPFPHKKEEKNKNGSQFFVWLYHVRIPQLKLYYSVRRKADQAYHQKTPSNHEVRSHALSWIFKWGRHNNYWTEYWENRLKLRPWNCMNMGGEDELPHDMEFCGF